MGNIFKSDFVFLGLVIIASLLFVSGLGSSAIMGLLGYSGLSLAEVMARTELNASRAILAQQGLGSLAIFLIPGVAMLQRWAYQEARELPVESPALERSQWTLKQSILAWAMIPALLPMLEWLTGRWVLFLETTAWGTEAIARSEEQATLVERLLFLPHWGDQVLAVVVFVLIAAVGEELFFRGALQRIIRSRMGASSVFASAALFAAFHFDLLHLPFLVIAGLALAWLFELSGRLWVPLVAHVIHNALTYLQALESGPGSYAHISPVPFTGMVVASALASVAIFMVLRRK
jgi:membrane protease YdiL (CAAX protease family)